MRLLAACSLGGAGHWNPLVPFLRAARRRGDETLVIGPPALREMVERTGFPFEAGGEPSEEEIAPIREQLPVLPRPEATVLGNRELFGRLAASAMLPAMERTCSQWAPDLVLRDPCEYASAVVAPRLGIPTAQVAISVAEGEAASIDAAAPALDEYRPGLAGELRASPYLSRFPASLDPSPFPTTVRFRAPEVEEIGEAAGRAPLPDWWDGVGGPLVYLTFGTVLGHMTIAGDAYRTALRAAERLDARVLLTVGRRFDPADLGPVPANVHVETWVDQADVLAHADLVVCHGGSGTVFGALAAGLPIVAVPFFADQFENARRVAAAGAGRTVEPPDSAAIAEAAEAVLATRAYRAAAGRLAAEMAAAPTAGEVLGALHR